MRRHTRLKALLGSFSNSVCNNRTLINQSTKYDRVPGPSEEDEGPSVEVGLGSWGRAGRMDKKLSKAWEAEGRSRNAHITRCRLERRIPPLKRAMASPRLQIA